MAKNKTIISDLKFKISKSTYLEHVLILSIAKPSAIILHENV